MRAGTRRAQVAHWRGTRPVTWPGEVFDPAWRKPARKTPWQRFMRWLNAP